MGNVEKEGKQKLSFQSAPARPGLENFKKIAKKFKKLKNLITASFQAKTGWKGQEREKNYRSDQFFPNS